MFACVLVCVLAALHGGRSSPIGVPVESYDTIVVGLGSAGTTAATELAKAGKRVLALEAQDRIGGRVHTVPFGDGVAEIGAEWIHGTENSRVYDAALSKNITILDQGLYFDAFFSDGTEADKALVNELMNYGLEAYGNPPETPGPVGQHVTSKLMEYIRTKHSDLLKNQDFIDEYLRFMNLVVISHEAANDWNEVSTHGSAVELGGSQTMSWHKYGYKTFFDIMLNRYDGGPGIPNLDIKLNTEVMQITWPQDPTADVTVTCRTGAIYKAKNVIVTVSVGVLKERHQTLFSPQLPPSKIESIEHISIGSAGKILMAFEEPWWNTSLNFQAFIWKGDERRAVPAKDQWTTNILGVYSPMGSNNTIGMWLNEDAVKVAETLPLGEAKAKSIALMKRFIARNTDIPEPTAFVRSTWYSNPYTRGSYTFDGLQVTKYPNARVVLGEPLLDSSGAPRLLFAGEATNLLHFATVHGASETGLREANRILQRN